ncbi:actin-like ATPase domain-containing protein [Rickenella mellea]|uniref:Actin-like ATPase domain-containing protein n=1 Tax=Rickenella mellea TaxID=50990 RepID=A0A4Y7PKL4_9AGAM|nr:actin-like ATPase domain-containing protein [Rickenella mellea]
MPPSSPQQAHFLGIELATDQLRAAVVDDALDLIGVACVDFDTDLPEFQTQGGIFTTPGDAYTTPIDMWVKALDILLEKLRLNFDLSKIKAIGGAAQHACVWWRSPTASFPLATLNPHQTIHAQLPSSLWTIPNTPVSQDTSSHPYALALEQALGGPEAFALLSGTPAHAGLAAASVLRVRETAPGVWASTGRIMPAGAWLASILSGGWAKVGEGEACAMGMWNVQRTVWEERVCEVVAGGRDEGRNLVGLLGDVDIGGSWRGSVGSYFVERYGFSPDTFLTSFTPEPLSTYLSLLPSPTDSVLTFGPMDVLMTPAPHYLPSRLYTLVPHPAQALGEGEKRRYIAMLISRNGDVPRALVRDMYTKSWSAFDRLVAIVPPGGSIGLDDKLFSFWLLQGDLPPLAPVKGIFRFETGIKVGEFRDLRANPRCLLESQLLSFRTRYARMRASNLFFPTHRAAAISSLSSGPAATGLSFDPYSLVPLPRRILTTGAAANFSSVVNLLGDVFNAPIFVPTTQLDSAQHSPHRNAPAAGCCARAPLGAAYVARWVWGREGGGGSGSSTNGTFEDEVRRLLTKRWLAKGGGRKEGTPSSGSPAPYLHSRSSGLGSTILVEESDEEDEIRDQFPPSGGVSPYGSLNGHGDRTPPPRMRTTTSSSGVSMANTNSSGGIPPSTAFTSPEVNLHGGGVNSNALTNNLLSHNLLNSNPHGSSASPPTPTGTNGSAPPGITPLTPVAALPTGDAEAQVGLAKVAEPDTDAFMTYASIVPEFCRLETMLVKGLV